MFLYSDMRGEDLPKPYFETKMKVRWDDERLYIGVYMQETDFWGTLTEDESQSTYVCIVKVVPLVIYVHVPVY